jgi:hydantoinase/carbamoylase family amidase
MDNINIFSNLRVNPERLRLDFDVLKEIGQTNVGGAHHPSLKDTYLAARTWFKKRIIDAGLEFRVDTAGNYSAFLSGGSRNAKTILLGSQLESTQLKGGFESGLGLVAALEVLRVLKEAGIKLGLNLEAVDFTNFGMRKFKIFGSSADAGKIPYIDIKKRRDSQENPENGYNHIGLIKERINEAKRNLKTLAGYFELNFEPTNQLSNANIHIGFASKIIGHCSYTVTYIGRAEPSGETSMKSRKDASLGANAFVLAVREIIVTKFPDCFGNVGNLEFFPGAVDVVPGQVIASLDFWAPEIQRFNHLEAELIKRAHQEADRFGLELKIDIVSKHQPVKCHASIVEAIKQAADFLKLDTTPIVSLVDNNCRLFADICPSGTIFIPSVDGMKTPHHEFSNWNDCVNGANVLLHSVLRFANSEVV